MKETLTEEYAQLCRRIDLRCLGGNDQHYGEYSGVRRARKWLVTHGSEHWEIELQLLDGEAEGRAGTPDGLNLWFHLTSGGQEWERVVVRFYEEGSLEVELTEHIAAEVQELKDGVDREGMNFLLETWFPSRATP